MTQHVQLLESKSNAVHPVLRAVETWSRNTRGQRDAAHAAEDRSATKEDQVMPAAATPAVLEIRMLTEKSDREDKYRMMSHVYGL